MSLDPSSILSGALKLCLMIYEAVGRANVNKARCSLLKDRIKVIEMALRSFVINNGISSDGALQGLASGQVMISNPSGLIGCDDSLPKTSGVNSKITHKKYTHAACVNLTDALQLALNLIVAQIRSTKVMAVLKSCAFSDELDRVNKRLSECANDFQISLVVDAAAEHAAMKNDLASLNENLQVIGSKLDAHSLILLELLKIAKGGVHLLPSSVGSSQPSATESQQLNKVIVGNGQEVSEPLTTDLQQSQQQLLSNPKALSIRDRYSTTNKNVRDGALIETSTQHQTALHRLPTPNLPKLALPALCPANQGKVSGSLSSTTPIDGIQSMPLASLLVSSSKTSHSNIPSTDCIFELQNKKFTTAPRNSLGEFTVRSSLYGRLVHIARPLLASILNTKLQEVSLDTFTVQLCFVGGLNMGRDGKEIATTDLFDSNQLSINCIPTTMPTTTTPSTQVINTREIIPAVGILLAEIGSMRRLESYLAHQNASFSLRSENTVLTGQLAQYLTEMLLMSETTEDEEEEDAEEKLNYDEKPNHTSATSRKCLPALITLVQLCCDPVVSKRPASLEEVQKFLLDICGENSQQATLCNKKPRPLPPTAVENHIDPYMVTTPLRIISPATHEQCGIGFSKRKDFNSFAGSTQSFASPQGLSPAQSTPSSSFASRTDSFEGSVRVLKKDDKAVITSGPIPPPLPLAETTIVSNLHSDFNVASEIVYSPRKHLCEEILASAKNNNKLHDETGISRLAGGLKEMPSGNLLSAQKKEKHNSKNCCAIQ